MRVAVAILTLTAILTQSINALTVLLPFGEMQPGITVSVGGVGPDGRTTFVASATSNAPDNPVPTVTFLEGPSDIIVPTQSFNVPVGQGQVETFILYQSCGVGPGRIANCLVSEEVQFMGTTEASAIRETVTVSVLILSEPVSSSTLSPTILSSSVQITPTPTLSTSSLNTSDFFSSTDSISSTNSITVSVPTLTGGAISLISPPAGLVALLSSLLILL